MGLTLVEKKLLAACRIALGYLTLGTAKTTDYVSLLDIVGRAVQAGSNKETGCPSGAHRSAGECTCTEEKEGLTSEYVKYGQKYLIRQKGKK